MSLENKSKIKSHYNNSDKINEDYWKLLNDLIKWSRAIPTVGRKIPISSQPEVKRNFDKFNDLINNAKSVVEDKYDEKD